MTLILLGISVVVLPYAEVFDPENEKWITIGFWNDIEVAWILAPLLVSILISLIPTKGTWFLITSTISLVVSGLYLGFTFLAGMPIQDFVPRLTILLMFFVFPVMVSLKYVQYLEYRETSSKPNETRTRSR